MSVHIHKMRSYSFGALGLILAVILLGWAYAPRSGESELAAVSGRVTSEGHPVGGMWILFEEVGPRGSFACCLVQADGSFRMQPWGGIGPQRVAPGTYLVHFIPRSPAAPESSVDDRAPDSWTSGLMVQVGPGWNDFVFSLPEPGQSPTLAHHR